MCPGTQPLPPSIDPHGDRQLYNSFVRNVNIWNSDSGIYSWGSAQCTFTDIVVGLAAGCKRGTGADGHRGVWLEHGTENLVTRWGGGWGCGWHARTCGSVRGHDTCIAVALARASAQILHPARIPQQECMRSPHSKAPHVPHRHHPGRVPTHAPPNQRPLPLPGCAPACYHPAYHPADLR